MMSPAAGELQLSVIIPSYQRAQDLRRCLEGLTAGHRPPEETLIVLTEGDEESRQMLATLPELCAALHLRVVESGTPGQIPQMNAGLTEARGEVVCFTDDDCVPRPDWLERLEQPYADPQIGGVGGRDVVHEGDTLSEGPGHVVGKITWYGRVIGNHHLIFPPGLIEVDHLKGANMSFRRELAGLFDMHMVLGPGSGSLNDTDFSLGVRSRGYRLVYDPQAVVDHFPAARHGRTHRDLSHPQQVYLDSHNWVYCMLKRLSPWRRLAFLAYAVLVGSGNRLGLVKYLLQVWRRPLGATRQLATTWRGLAAGLRDWWKAHRELPLGLPKSMGSSGD